MSVTNYYVVGNEIIGQELSAMRSDYIADVLGSVVVVVDQAKAVIASIRYKPFGSDLARTGSTLFFGWVGSLGYAETGMAGATHYVRARHFDSGHGSWRSTDPLWPKEHAYSYVLGNPTTRRDPSGLSFDYDTFGCGNTKCPPNIDPCGNISNLKPGDAGFNRVMECLKGKGFGDYLDSARIAINFMRTVCSAGSQGGAGGSGGGPKVCVACAGATNFPASCGPPCSGGAAAESFPISPPQKDIKCPPNETLTPYNPADPCTSALKGMGCQYVISMCPRSTTSGESNTTYFNCYQGFYHELAHSAGLKGSPDHSTARNDLVYAIGSCICNEVTSGKVVIPNPCR